MNPNNPGWRIIPPAIVAALAATATTHTDDDITPAMLAELPDPTPDDDSPLVTRGRAMLAELLDAEDDLGIALALSAWYTEHSKRIAESRTYMRPNPLDAEIAADHAAKAAWAARVVNQLVDERMRGGMRHV
jgi:hypothetical protein